MSKKNKLPVASTEPVNPAPNTEKDFDDRRYKAEDALRVIERAENYKKDKALMKDVKALAREKIKCLGNIK